MQITETSSDGLKRQLRVVVGAGEINERFQERLTSIKDSVQLKGFRKGKVPEAHLKRMFGRSVMTEALQQVINETSQKALTDRKERPAGQPKIELAPDQNDLEKVLDGGGDLAFDMTFEVLPDIKMTDFAGLKLKRLTADVDPGAVETAVAGIAERNTRYETEEGRTAGEGDRVTIDFVGRIDGETFENGSGEDAQLVLGQGQFIPGFEDGLKGAKAGEDKTISVTFPDTYPVATLKSKAATFDVKVKEVAKPIKPAIDDELAKSLGAENLTQLREMITGQLQREYEQVSRQKLKRALLDELDKAHEFQLPPSLVDAEFDGIWQQVTRGLEQAKRTFADEGKTEEQAREEYRKIAERRVRLGLLIGEVGEKNKIEVSQEELRQSLIQQARRFPGQEKVVYEYYEKNPQAVAELRAPIFEDKVVDFILELAKPESEKVAHDVLMKPEDDEAGAATA